MNLYYIDCKEGHLIVSAANPNDAADLWRDYMENEWNFTGDVNHTEIESIFQIPHNATQAQAHKLFPLHLREIQHTHWYRLDLTDNIPNPEDPALRKALACVCGIACRYPDDDAPMLREMARRAGLRFHDIDTLQELEEH